MRVNIAAGTGGGIGKIRQRQPLRQSIGKLCRKGAAI
jgi:hypothetical protein